MRIRRSIEGFYKERYVHNRFSGARVRTPALRELGRFDADTALCVTEYLPGVRFGDIHPGRFAGLLDELAGSCPEERGPIHGDSGSSNLLTDGRRITGIIDWDRGAFGDPLYDVANLLSWRNGAREAEPTLYRKKESPSSSADAATAVHRSAFPRRPERSAADRPESSLLLR